MGCQCSPKRLDQQTHSVETDNHQINNCLSSQDGNNNNNNNDIVNYANSVFTLINKIRCSPFLYAKDIENAIENIKTEEGRMIYAGKLRVGIFKGIDQFKQVAEELKLLAPMPSLIFKEDIVIPSPTEEEQIKDPQFFHKSIIDKKKEVQIDNYFKEAVKDPLISVLMIIVDDTEKNAGKKRATVLNKDYKYIGISSTMIGKSFCAYYTFAK